MSKKSYHTPSIKTREEHPIPKREKNGILPVTKNTVFKFISATAGAILEHEFGE